MYWIQKYEVALQYGGAEEGGWWYEAGDPVEGWIPEPFIHEETAYARCRDLNEAEHERAEKEEDYEYSSVLSYRSTHYSYRVEDSSIPQPYPTERLHYE